MNLPKYNATLQLLQIIGTPFDEPQVTELSNLEADKLYSIATRNKIGLLFLESLARFRSLYSLQSNYEQLLAKYIQLCNTAEHVGSILNMIKCNYAIIKTLMPFHAVPNDVDVLILGDDQEFKSAEKSILDSTFVLLGEAPLEICFHDLRDGPHDNPSVKDPYDVDIYREVGASHVIYMDKKRLRTFVTEFRINSTKVQIMTPPAELAISIFHSIFPERMYTLMLHYQILHLLNKMTDSEFDMFVQILEETRTSKAVLYVISITEAIQVNAFGQCPAKIKKLIDLLGSKKYESDAVNLPYVYPLQSILKSFWYKKFDFTFTKSLLRQTMTLIKPSMAAHVIAEFSNRRSRDTY